MSLDLYFAPGACSFVPHCLLEVSGAAYAPKLVKLHKGEHQSEDYKALNPHGQVPLLVANGQPVNQILAICQYIAEAFPAAHFAPTEPLAKARFMETLSWMNNTVHPTFTHVFMPQKYSDDAAAQSALKTFNTALFKQCLAEINDKIGQAKAAGGQWLAALYGHDHFTALDAYSLTFTRWGSIIGIDPLQWTHTWAHIQQLKAHPAVGQVIERERLNLNLMAA